MQPNEDSRVSRTDPFKGRVLDKYLLIERLGAGGMGMVYLAEQKQLKRQVAVKLLSLRLINDEVNVKRIEREATAMAKLQHPNIATVIDFGVSEDGQPYLVMELIQGQSLKTLLKGCKYLPAQRVLTIMSQVADAMAYAHKHGFIHRDLKPDNIMLASNHKEDFVKILDFGIAKSTLDATANLTKAGDMVGSPLYMSPEQCTGKKVDERSDIYSLGVIMYECLTGIIPCQGATLFETISKKTMELPPPFPAHLSHLQAIEALTLACLATYPEQRPPAMQLVKDSLEAMLSFPPGSTPAGPGFGAGPASGYGSAMRTTGGAYGDYPPGGMQTGGGAYPPGGMQTGGGVYPPGGMQTGGGVYPPGGMQTGGGVYPPGGMQTGGGVYPPMGAPGGAFFPGGVQTTGGGYPGMQSTSGGYAPPGMQSTGGGFTHGYSGDFSQDQASGQKALLSKHIVLCLVVAACIFLGAGTALGVFFFNLSNKDVDTVTDGEKTTSNKSSNKTSENKSGAGQNRSEDVKSKTDKSGLPGLSDDEIQKTSHGAPERKTDTSLKTSPDKPAPVIRQTRRTTVLPNRIISRTIKIKNSGSIRNLPRHGGGVLPLQNQGRFGNGRATEGGADPGNTVYIPPAPEAAKTQPYRTNRGYSSGSEFSGIYQNQQQSGQNYYKPRTAGSELPLDVQKFRGYYGQKYGY